MFKSDLRTFTYKKHSFKTTSSILFPAHLNYFFFHRQNEWNYVSSLRPAGKEKSMKSMNWKDLLRNVSANWMCNVALWLNLLVVKQINVFIRINFYKSIRFSKKVKNNAEAWKKKKYNRYRCFQIDFTENTFLETEIIRTLEWVLNILIK